MTAVTRDAFLGGRITCLQPKPGFRAGSDTVLLASAVNASPGDAVLELGCGAGVGLCCLGARVADLALFGLELQRPYADLARQNLVENGLSGTIIEGDVSVPPRDLGIRAFDAVFFNPPYYLHADSSASTDRGRDRAQRGEDRLIAAFIDTALKRLKPKGHLAMIVPADQLGTVLAALSARAGRISVLPLAARPGREADRVIIRAVKGAKTPLRLLAPMYLHDAPAHESDGGAPGAVAQSILRDGMALAEP